MPTRVRHLPSRPARRAVIVRDTQGVQGKPQMKSPFFNLYSHGFARVAVGVPRCRVADPEFNAAQTLELAKQAAERGAVLVAFPELGLSAYTCDDLFHQNALLEACKD